MEDAPMNMNELTHRDKTVLRQLFGAVGFFASSAESVG
jgi:hypothetical protein